MGDFLNALRTGNNRTGITGRAKLEKMAEEWRGEIGPYGCWVWPGLMTGNRYAQILIDGHCLSAHRVMYEYLVGPIPTGLQLDHRCHNKACVNPAHLEPVTASENLRRRRPYKHRKGLTRKRRPKKGL